LLKFDKKQVQRLYSYVIIVMIIGVEALTVLYFLPKKIASLKEAQNNISQLTAEVRTLQETVNQLSGVKPAVLEADLKRARLALPDEKKASGVILGLTKLASSSGVVLVSAEFSPGVMSTESARVTDEHPNVSTLAIGENVEVIPIQVGIIGGVDNIASFVKKISATGQLLGVNRVAFDAGLGQGSNTNIELFFYFQPPKESLGKVSQSFQISDQDNEIIKAIPSDDAFTLLGE